MYSLITENYLQLSYVGKCTFIGASLMMFLFAIKSLFAKKEDRKKTVWITLVSSFVYIPCFFTLLLLGNYFVFASFLLVYIFFIYALSLDKVFEESYKEKFYLENGMRIEDLAVTMALIHFVMDSLAFFFFFLIR